MNLEQKVSGLFWKFLCGKHDTLFYNNQKNT